MSGFLILGPLSKDTIIKDGLKTHSVGGAVYYQSRVFSSLNLNHTAVVTLAADDQNQPFFFTQAVNVMEQIGK
ncbi:MAG: hypothetical protein KUA33_03970 [Methanobacterium sp.]|nr:hypothetical protein [Methanobacterium sp.]